MYLYSSDTFATPYHPFSTPQNKTVLISVTQGICENVFLRPSPVFGVLMAGIPGPAYQDVTRTLCLCARGVTSLTAGIPWQRPAAAVRETLLDVLHASVGDGEGSDGGHGLPYDGGGGDSAEFLFDDCETIVSPITLT